ncbi:hypothetical protein JCM15765_26330 [Paradesulfitobacterium aromaticivorans]
MLELGKACFKRSMLTTHQIGSRPFLLVQELGWVVLINDATYLSELKLWLIGVDDPSTAHDDVDRAYSRLNASSPTSASSNLQSFRPLRLVLARYHIVNGVPLYINRGIGNSKLALRFNVIPEVAVFTLYQGPQNAVHS